LTLLLVPALLAVLVALLPSVPLFSAGSTSVLSVSCHG
jgi:hypothetical protein